MSEQIGLVAIASADDEKRAVEEWAAITFPPSPRGRMNRGLSRHAAASAIHGWAEHAHHTGASIVLARHDYIAALIASDEPAAGTADYVPHLAALSPYKGR